VEDATMTTTTKAITIFGQGLARVRWTEDHDDLQMLVGALDAVELMEEPVGSDGFTSRAGDVHGVLTLFPSCHPHEEHLGRGCASAPAGAVSRRHARAALASGITRVSEVSTYIESLPWHAR
jgi:hypothetical protein